MNYCPVCYGIVDFIDSVGRNVCRHCKCEFDKEGKKLLFNPNQPAEAYNRIGKAGASMQQQKEGIEQFNAATKSLRPIDEAPKVCNHRNCPNYKIRPCED